jgi:hypothetical protein
MQNRARRGEAVGGPAAAASATLAPGIEGTRDPQTLFPDEDDDAATRVAPEPERFALFPDESDLAAAAPQRAAPPPPMFERTTADRLGAEARTFTVTPRLILLALIVVIAAFTAVRACQVTNAVATASTAAPR